ncbi:MAG: ATP-binding protein [Ruminococcaceae bacterium]|nr:ATP-binding protein [Oscillospiraceae bacterium]
MDRETSRLLLFSELGENAILNHLSEIFKDFRENKTTSSLLIRRIYTEIKHLLDLATQYGFDKNLWHNYLTFLLITNENSFSLTAERRGAGEGSVNHFAKNDFRIFRNLFHFDFSEIENALGIDCFSTLCNYKAIAKSEKNYYRSVSEKVQALSEKLAKAENEEEFFSLVTDFYRLHGVGMFGLNRAFRIKNNGTGVAFLPINNTDKVMLSDMVGYEIQKKALTENTEAFLKGIPANNVLLYGDAGTGKSSCVKALINEYYDEGLRMIEIYKHQFRDLSEIIATVKNRNYRFIIFIDDLSFEESELEYKFLKAVIEGGVETRPDNILIYATSNRRHLIKETWNDRNDMEFEGELHRSDTMEEKLSLAARFGVTVNFNAPNRKLFHDIVKELAKRRPNIHIDEEELLNLANRWEIRHGGISGRTAQQFINYLEGRESTNHVNT